MTIATTSDIEMRVCINTEPANGEVAIEVIEVYVQWSNVYCYTQSDNEHFMEQYWIDSCSKCVYY